jgi:hypothetical protein
MRSFFHGWKRKLGCVTLLLGSAALMGWLRCQTIHDEIQLIFGNQRIGIYSISGEFAIFRWYGEVFEPKWPSLEFSLNNEIAHPAEPYRLGTTMVNLVRIGHGTDFTSGPHFCRIQ